MRRRLFGVTGADNSAHGCAKIRVGLFGGRVVVSQTCLRPKTYGKWWAGAGRCLTALGPTNEVQ